MSNQKQLLSNFVKQRVQMARSGDYEQALNILSDIRDSKRIGDVVSPYLNMYLVESAERFVFRKVSLRKAFNVKRPRKRPKGNLIERDLNLALAVHLEVQRGNKTKDSIDDITKRSTVGRKAVEAAYYKHRNHVKVLCSLGDVGWRAISPLNT